MFSYLSPEAMVPSSHPLRLIRPIVNAALKRFSEVAPFQWTVFGLAGYVAAGVIFRSASYAMGDR